QPDDHARHPAEERYPSSGLRPPSPARGEGGVGRSDLKPAPALRLHRLLPLREKVPEGRMRGPRSPDRAPGAAARGGPPPREALSVTTLKPAPASPASPPGSPPVPAAARRRDRPAPCTAS